MTKANTSSDSIKSLVGFWFFRKEKFRATMFGSHTTKKTKNNGK